MGDNSRNHSNHKNSFYSRSEVNEIAEATAKATVKAHASALTSNFIIKQKTMKK